MNNLFRSLTKGKGLLVAMALLLSVSSMNLSAQCTAESGKIQGKVFLDFNNDGSEDPSEVGVSSIIASIYDANNNLVEAQPTNSDGNFEFDGLSDGTPYRVEFDYFGDYVASFIGSSNQSSVQFVNAPACNVNFGVIEKGLSCGENPEVITSCFVQGPTEGNDIETLIGFEYGFNASSPVRKYASHSETGTVWGVAWKGSTSEIFSSAFVKQYGGLTKAGYGAIYKTAVTESTSTTTLYTDLASKVNLGTMNVTDEFDCAYGAQTGMVGLGALVLAPDQEYLYVTNLGGKSIIKLSTTNPDDVSEFSIPDPGCSDGEYAPFALKLHDGKLYIGVTCTAMTSRTGSDSKAIVYEWDPANTSEFNIVFETSYIKGYWTNTPATSIFTSHWFTDIDFTNEGNMLLGLSDRVGHRYCKVSTSRLDSQNPDILMAYKDNDGNWTLESNGSAGSLIGSGVGNGQGPGGGEFFGEEAWPGGPTYHPEIALGSFYVLKGESGSGSVVAAVYDPAKNSYSGGFHRYSTVDGTREAGIELYVRNSTEQFGKATGFGDVVAKCSPSSIEIGNLVWRDDNKNGIQDAGEPVIAGITLNLMDEDCNILGTETTDANGQYKFSNLIEGKQYYIGIPASEFDYEYGILNFGGEDFVLTSENNTNGFINSDASLVDIDCGKVLLPIQTNITNHSYDIGFVKPNGFDLALKKEILNSGIVEVGETVPFRITVYNQGGIPAKDIVIRDYIPSGYEFVASDNPDWTVQGGDAITTITATLIPGSSVSRIIRLKVIASNINDLVNVAEITDATDHNGNDVVDVDSVMDDVMDNDTGGDVGTPTDDNVTDDGTIDEDDSDPAVPNIFDLALRQYYENSHCVTGGSQIDVKIDVYNQGNVPSRSFTVVNYGSPNLTFDKAKNPAWKELNGLYVYEGGVIAPGTKITIELTFDVINISQEIDIINYSEISSSIPEGRNDSVDSDSTPDDQIDNDKGGTPNTDEDNNVDGLEDSEEDDHDPIVISSRAVDLALLLTTESRMVNSGDVACFNVMVVNQGQMPIKQFDITNYLPSTLSMNDSGDWDDVSGNHFTKTVLYPQGFAPGSEYHFEYCTTVGNLDGVYLIENAAEISQITGMCDEDLSNKDRDSKADNIIDNDLGGEINTDTDDSINQAPSVDEDDHDPAFLIHVETSITNTCQVFSCPTLNDEGLYEIIIELNAPPGMTWTMDQALNLYTTASAVNNLIAFSGESMTETAVDATHSTYSISGVAQSGATFDLRLKSDNNDYQYLSDDACSFASRLVSGERALCNAAQETYAVPNGDNATFVATVTGGSILATRNNGAEVDVEWDAVAGVKQIYFEKTSGDCENFAVLDVITGNTDLAMKCKSQVNLSINADCEVEITPQHILAGDPDPEAAYAIMLFDEDGALMPDNIVNHEHIGKNLEVKLIEGCGGNSCWGNILIEDKSAPTILCEDVTVSCYKVDQYRGPVALDNCGDPIVLHTLDSILNPVSCDPLVTGIFTKSFQAEDASGNKSEICNQTIYIARINLDSVVFPASIEMANALSCNGYDTDDNGYPAPHLTGVPTIEGESIYPDFDGLCKVHASYKDEGPYPFECAQKIVRTWTVWDISCIPNPVQRSFEQTIVIGDKENPTFVCPPSKTASASYHDCIAKVGLDLPTNMDDDCSTDFRIDATYPGGFIDDMNGGEVIDLPAGNHLITYRIYDECLRSNSCTYTIEVEDNTSPLAVCDQNTTIALLSDGTSYMYAQTLDDGSTDACGIAQIEARRMDLGANCNLKNNDFGPIVEFCCNDVGPEPIVVEMMVTDNSDNTNSCMVNVFVQDKTRPTISCPDDVTIDCRVFYDLEDLSEYGEATFYDVCGADLDEEVTEYIDRCRLGYIERIFTVDDGANQVSCRQYIYVENNDVFDLSDIEKPQDFEVFNTCTEEGLHPDSLSYPYGRPVLNEGICDLVAASFKDKRYRFTDTLGTCFKIVRRWTVINYCDLDIDGHPSEIEFDQVIKVSNTEAPKVSFDEPKVTAFLYDTSCVYGYIELEATGDDACTPDAELNWVYQIFEEGGTTPIYSDKGKGALAIASGEYELGSYFVLWSFEDMCGNVESRRQDFEIIDNKKPTAACLESVAISLVAMDTDGVDGPDIEMACIGPDSLNASSFHPCLDPSELTFSFDSLGMIDEMCFDCFDLGENIIEWYVIDPYGNFDICNVRVIVQDNNDEDVCPDLEDCIEWPVDVTITECNGDTTPIALNSMPVIDPDCECTDFDAPTYVDSLIAYPNATCTMYERTWTVTFNCGNNSMTFEYLQKISVLNDQAPEISCPANVTVDANGDCEAVISPLIPTISNDNCNTDIIVTHNSTHADNPGNDASGTYPKGTTTIIFTVEDGCENTDTCHTTIVVEDNTPPIAMCTDITVSLDGDTHTLTQQEIDAITAGSEDNCELSLSISPTTFDCDDIDASVTVTVTAFDGNTSTSCTAEVTVEDDEDPTVVCNDITIDLDDNGNVTLTEADIETIGNGSSDNCNELDFEVNESTFDCTDFGVNTITLTVSDDSGNTASCEAEVTVDDDQDPVAVCTDITVNLNVNGIHNLTSQEMNTIGSASSDNCGFNISSSPNSFDCSHVGDNNVTVTITDIAGNVDDCIAIVTVQDITPPTIPAGGCNDVTIMLDAMLMGMLDADDLAAATNGASDACGFVPSANAMFDCDDVGNPVTVTITLTDPSNNTSMCDITVTVEEATTPTLMCNDITINLLEDGTYALTAMDSMEMVDQSMGTCNTSIEIEQVTFDCDDIPSVEVTVELFDATNTLVGSCESNITVLDTFPPAAICNDITVTLDANGVYTFVSADVTNIGGSSTDACGIDTMFIDLISLTCDQIGDTTATLTVEDNNGNTSTCEATVTLEDDSKIMAVCNDITINISSDAPYTLTSADSIAIVGGSTDNCAFIVDINPHTFTCADTMNSPISITVDFENSQGSIDTTCMAEVTVETDNTLTCIAQDITVYLDSLGTQTITADDIDGGSGAGCNSAVNKSIDINSFVCNDVVSSPITVTLTVSLGGENEACTAEVTVLDTIAPQIYCQPLIQISCDTFDGNFNAISVIDSIVDNCTDYLVDTLVLIDQFNSCGQGILSRDIIVFDPLSNNSDTCNAVISIIETSDPLTATDFNFPADITVDNCQDLDPGTTGDVTLIGAVPQCSFIEISFTDNPPVPPGGCTDTIERTWTIVDTCNSNVSIPAFVQEIVIIDTIGPDLMTSLDTLFVPNPNNECEMMLDLSSIVTNADCGQTGTVYINNSPFADNNNDIDASGTYPTGDVYDIEVIAMDGCGLSDTAEYVIVIDTAEYLFTCDKLIVPIDTTTLMVCVAATDVASVSGACDSNYTILLYDPEEDVLSDTLKFDCDDIGDNPVFVYLYNGTTLIDSCTVRSDLGRTLITVTDNFMKCNNNIGRVSGNVKTYYNKEVEAVQVELEGSEMPYEMTDGAGSYAFPDMPSGGNYMIKPVKDDGLLEGVSTLDLVLIQRHILGIGNLHNAYDIVAADVNNDNRVTSSDLVELRKAIIGYSSSFKNNTSWKMIDGDYEFPVSDNPFAEEYPEFTHIAPLNGTVYADFTGIKIGDVNGSYTPLRSDVGVDNRSNYKLSIEEQVVVENEVVQTTIKATNPKELLGLQMALEIQGLISVQSLSIEGMKSDYHVSGDVVTLSMSSALPIGSDDLEIAIEFVSTNTGRLSSMMKLDDVMENELYDSQLNIHNIDLTWNNNTSNSIFSMVQNTPNPWKDKTYVSYTLPVNSSVTVTITDMAGKMLYNREIEGQKGINTLEIKNQDVDMESGVFVVTFDYEGQRLQQKMIRLK